jgi:lysophospholipase L1-like esterase
MLFIGNKRSLLWSGLSLAGKIRKLFAAGQPGAWYDPSDFTTLFQDSGGTTPVTAVGQPVGKMLDKSGRGNHMTLTSATLQQTSGKYYIQYNGSTTFGVTSAINLTATNKVTMCAGLYYTGAAAGSMIEFSANPGAINGGFGLVANNLVAGNIASVQCFTGASGQDTVRPAGEAFVCNVNYDLSAVVTGGARIRLNGFQAEKVSNVGSASSVGNFGNHPLYTGKRGGVSGATPMRLYGIVLIGLELQDADMRLVEAYIAAISGVALPFLYATSNFSDNGAIVPMPGYSLSSPFSTIDLLTDATSVEVIGYTNMYVNYPNFTRIGIVVDGVYQESINPTANGVFAKRVNFPVGVKVISFVNGPQSKPSSTVLGTFITGLRGNAAATQTGLGVSGTVIYGDSISTGDAATPTMQNAWVPLVRAAGYPSQRFAVEAWGFRSLYEDCATEELRVEFVAKLAAYNPQRIWLSIGTNDYGLNKWSASAFGAAYAALLDDLHAALPSVVIYAQTPIVRTAEAANGSGSTLGDYRAQISAAVSTRTGYTTLVDGTAFMTTGSLSDGIHPNTAGHALYANAVKAVLGIL